MSSRIKTASVILSAILIASCATDRIQFAQKEGLDCITPETRYQQGKDLPIRAIKSNSRKYARNVNHTSWSRKHNSHSSGNDIKKDKLSEKPVYTFLETSKSRILTYPGIKEVISFQQIPESSGIGLCLAELKHIPYLTKIIYEANDFIKNPQPQDFGIPHYSYALENQNEEGVSRTEFIPAGPELIPDPLKSGQSQELPFSKKEAFILLIALLAGLIPLAAIKATPGLSSNISFWTAMNPWKTRIMYIGVNTGLIAGGILLGDKLADNGMHFSALTGDIALAAFLTAALLYPVRNSPVKLLKHSYLRQKVFDMALVLSGFMLMINAGNNNPALTASFTGMKNLNWNIQENMNISNIRNQDQKQIQYNQNVGQLQEEQVIPQKMEMSKRMKILLTVLTVLAGLGLGFLLLLAACGIACNGMEGLAYLVGIGGGILLIVLAVWVIKRIWNPNHKRKANLSEFPGSIPAKGTLQI